MPPASWRGWVVAALTLVLGCDGKLVGPGGPGGGTPSATSLKMGSTGAHRLSRDEYDITVRDLVGDTAGEGFGLLPEDAHDPFDNNYLTQLASQSLVDATEQLAIDIAGRLVADAPRLQSLLPCTPTGPGDAACLKKFIASFGRRALRRPLTDAEVAEYATLQSFAVEKGDFKVGVRLVVQAMLQDPEFLYRIERGTPAAGPAGTYRLSGFEVATRLSYFLWGSTPRGLAPRFGRRGPAGDEGADPGRRGAPPRRRARAAAGGPVPRPLARLPPAPSPGGPHRGLPHRDRGADPQGRVRRSRGLLPALHLRPRPTPTRCW